jgi:hypothetical protein
MPGNLSSVKLAFLQSIIGSLMDCVTVFILNSLRSRETKIPPKKIPSLHIANQSMPSSKTSFPKAGILALSHKENSKMPSAPFSHLPYQSFPNPL